MNLRKTLLFLFLLWGGLTSSNSNAQIYPVTANLTLIQPNSVYLSDYTTSGADNIRLTLLQNDQLNPSYDVKLRIKIEGSGIKIQTSPDFNTVPISLTNGIPELLNGLDIAAYLEPNALQFQGITREQYRRRAAIPDGFYRFSIQVFDYRTGVALSEEASTSAWFVLNDPPRLNLPACGVKLRPQDPAYIMFNWLGMQTGGGFATEYTFQLFWILPKGRNPNDLVLAMANNPMYETTTNTPSLIYGPAEPPLFPGEQYAWRVQAKETFGRDLFKNNGYSEVCWFAYGDACIPPTDVQASVEGSQRASITWEGAPATTQYKLYYREKEADKWYSVSTITEKATLTDFKPNTTYEYKVQSVCGVSYSEFSPTDTLRTRAAFANTVLSCGQVSKGEKIDSTQKLAALKPGDEVMVGNFKLIVAEASGSNGSFKGRGSMQIALLNTAVMGEFENLKINSQYQAYSGFVNVRSGAMALLPPEVRNKVTTYYTQITAIADQLDEGLGNTQALIEQGTTIVNKIDGIVDQVKDTDLNELRDKISEIKGIAQSGVGAAKDGDTTKGKNLLGNAVAALGDALGGVGSAVSGGADKLKELVRKLVKERKQKDSTERAEILATFPELESGARASQKELADDINNIELGGNRQEALSETVYQMWNDGDDIEDEIPEEMLIEMKKNSKYKNYIEKVEALASRLDKLDWLEQSLVVLITLVQPGEVDRLVAGIKADSQKMGQQFVKDILDGKLNTSIEDYAKKYLNQVIESRIQEVTGK